MMVSAAALAAPPRLLVLGDSLSSAHRIAVDQGWVALLDARLKQRAAATAPEVVNAAISGETTSGGIARLPALLARHQPRWVLIELGDHAHSHIIPRMRRVLDGQDPGGVTDATGWRGGGGFRFYRLAPS